MPLVRFWQHEAIGRSVNALVLGLLLGAVGVLGIAMSPGAELEEAFGLRWLFSVRGPVPPPAQVVIVAIDEQSSSDLGLPENPRGWPRILHAEVTRYLAEAGARVVAFDLTFDAPGGQPEHDDEFAAAMRSAGNVLLAESIRRDTIRLQGSDGQANGTAIIEMRNRPLQILEDAAMGSAPFMLPKDARVDTYWTFLDEARTTPTLPVLMFRVFAQGGPRGGRAAEPVPGPLIERFERTLRQLRASPESHFLNFYGPPRTIATVPYSHVVRAARATTAGQEVADARFRGKAVFVGFAAATPGGQDRLRDDYRTVYSDANGLDLSGVEIAATAFANLVDDSAVQPVSLARQIAIVVVWGLALGVICRLIRPIFAALIVAGLAGAYLWLVQDRFAETALWLPSITPVAMQAPLALFAGVWLSYRDSKREREVIKRAFGFFLPSGVVEQLTRNLGTMTRANRVVFGACLSTDAEKYTSLAERMDPARLGELMNAYYAELFVPVERSHGVVADVVGDSMVAVWARTASDIDVRRSACRATLEIAQALDHFGADDDERPPMPTRFGLHCGDMLFGSIGASGHFEYRAVGDIVNTASRIQGLNKVLGTRLLASEETVAGLDDLVTRPLGSFLLAGKAKPVSVVELVRAGPVIDDRERERDDAFAVALKAYTDGRVRDAKAGFARLADTEAGDGPSRFYAEHCRRLELDPAEGEWTPTIRIINK